MEKEEVEEVEVVSNVMKSFFAQKVWNGIYAKNMIHINGRSNDSCSGLA